MTSWLRRLRAPERTTGFPTSTNRASSFHLWWEGSPGSTAVGVTLEVLEPPAVPRLYFWALQVSFVGAGGRVGAAHIGLQWHPGHPGSRAVNWGGYDAEGAVLQGSDSPLASATGNPNTRDLAWVPSRRYRLEVGPGSLPGWWLGTVTDVETGTRQLVRELHAGGERLVDPVVWSEVFARCDDPPVAVRWSEPRCLPSGSAPARYRVTYQPVERGGCSNTDVAPDGVGVVQLTNRRRSVPDSSVIPIW